MPHVAAGIEVFVFFVLDGFRMLSGQVCFLRVDSGLTHGDVTPTADYEGRGYRKSPRTRIPEALPGRSDLASDARVYAFNWRWRAV